MRYCDQTTDGKIRGSYRGNKFFLLQNAQTGSEAHLASYSVRTGDPFQEVKWSELEADQLSSSNSEVKKKWSRTSASP